MIKFQINSDPSISEIIDRIPDGEGRTAIIDKVMDDGRFLFQESIMGYMNVATGTMRRSVETLHESPERSTVTVTAGYALFVDQGVQPHPIYPRNALSLRFFPTSFNDLGTALKASKNKRLSGRPGRGGAEFMAYARSVWHPGQGGSFFMEQGFNDALDGFTALASDTADQYLQTGGA